MFPLVIPSGLMTPILKINSFTSYYLLIRPTTNVPRSWTPGRTVASCLVNCLGSIDQGQARCLFLDFCV